MKIEKLSLKSVENALSKDEMKQIMAGSGNTEYCCSAGSNSFCDDDQGTMGAWAGFWNSAGYSVNCTASPIYYA